MRVKSFFKISLVCSVLFCICLLSCGKDKNTGPAVVYAPLLKSAKENYPTLSKLFISADTVRLKTSGPQSLLPRVNYVKFTDDYIFLSTEDERLLEFDWDGNYIRQIGYKGRGPGEYLGFSRFDILPDKEEVYLMSHMDGTINVYSFQGKYLRTIETKNMLSDFAVMPNGHFLFMSRLGFTEAGRGLYETDAEGNVLRVLFQVPNYVHDEPLEDYLAHISPDEMGYMPMKHDDTIYHILKDTIIKSMVVKTDIVMNKDMLNQRTGYYSDNGYSREIYRETDRVMAVILSGNQTVVRIFYDKVNDITYRDVSTQPVDVPESDRVPFFQSAYNGWFIRVHDAGEIITNPHLHQAFPEIDEDSNPVILLFR